MVLDPGNGIQPTSSTWAKKHIFGWSDEEIKVDLMQQRLERAIGEELKQTPTVISKTGLFDTIDKLYSQSSGNTSTAATAGAAPELGGAFAGTEEPTIPPAPEPQPEGEITAPAGVTPEGQDERMNILVENNIFKGDTYLELNQGQDSLGEIEKELDKLLNS